VLATGLLGPAALAACAPARTVHRPLRFATLAEALADIDALARAKAVQADATWGLAATLQHCAQSIEYAMTGFPQPKPRAFQATVGAAAYAYFAWRGQMAHDLAEPIPGAPPLAASTDPAADLATALARVRSAIAAFGQWSQALQPHFAYGALDKPAYERAHAMHLANHLQHFQAVA
jgi:hypothetical protein